MLDEFKKSIQSVFYERLNSPFSGAFVLSWFVCNWKLVYYIITESNKTAFSERIAFIEHNYINLLNNLLYPLGSAIFFVSIYPFVTTGTLYLWLTFKNWQNNIKNSIENNVLLTVPQSIELRLSLKNQHDKFNRLIEEKDKQIILAESSFSKLHDELVNAETSLSNKNEELSKLLKENETIKVDIKNYNLEIKKLNDTISVYDEKVEKLNTSLIANEKEIARKDLLISSINEELNNNRKTFSGKMTKMENFDKIIAEKEKEINNLKLKLSDNEEIIISLRNENNTLSTGFEKRNAELSKNQFTINELKKKNNTTQDKYEDALDVISKNNSQLEKYKEDIQLKSKQLKDLGTLISEEQLAINNIIISLQKETDEIIKRYWNQIKDERFRNLPNFIALKKLEIEQIRKDIW